MTRDRRWHADVSDYASHAPEAFSRSQPNDTRVGVKPKSVSWLIDVFGARVRSTIAGGAEGAGGQTLGRHGYSKDHRPDLRQTILAVLLDGDGRPVCTEMWPGNTADTGSLVPVVDRLRQRFSIGRVCIVADRGMISADTIAELEARGLLYLLGIRERTDKLVRELVLDDPGPCRERPETACVSAETGSNAWMAERPRANSLTALPALIAWGL
jgi:Transposase DDE domain